MSLLASLALGKKPVHYALVSGCPNWDTAVRSNKRGSKMTPEKIVLKDKNGYYGGQK